MVVAVVVVVAANEMGDGMDPAENASKQANKICDEIDGWDGTFFLIDTTAASTNRQTGDKRTDEQR